MWALILGIVIFYGVHAVPSFNLKNKLVDNWGELPYMGAFSLVAGLGLGLMIYGKSIAPFVQVWQPISGAHWLPIVLMWPASILISWAYLPCNMKIKLRHPMLLGILLFSVGHLFANGDLGTILLVGSFGVFAVVNMLVVNRRSKRPEVKAKAMGWDILGIVMGTVVYALVFKFHHIIVGVAVPV